jgi:hypothetical protein
MAVISNIEWKVQEAFLNALGTNPDLTALGVQLRRAHDEANPVNPPAVTVYCVQAQHPQGYAGRTAIDECFVELIAQTKVREDQTGQTAAEILGACRDQVRDGNFYQQLNAVVNFTAYGAEETGQSATFDSTTDRIRKLTVKVLCNPTDLTN